ncbi:yrdC domain-containing protein [Besnoitia besnoiti]|uniref:Threonylcarbamoyl-AMP synthase n=1 Tax=Besnoitia besnoiti TaxID=94643 RepID=A0A2A9M9X2_BESBE|nr:yrdC domain-containing protein [Besnoitia besnoiti]PFH32407.1 yrdC domain-containing protein [Besnoitia besnoiti]
MADWTGAASALPLPRGAEETKWQVSPSASDPSPSASTATPGGRSSPASLGRESASSSLPASSSPCPPSSSLTSPESPLFSCPPVLVWRAPPRPSVAEAEEAIRECTASPSSLLPAELRLTPSAESLLQLFTSSFASSPSTLSGSAAAPTRSRAAPFVSLAQVRALAAHPVFAALGTYLRRGGLVVFPTETVYGLGAAATVPGACARVFLSKRRPPSDPLICHVVSAQQAFAQVFDLDDDPSPAAAAAQPPAGGAAESPAWQLRGERRAMRQLVAALADAFWPGPLSVVARGKILEDRPDGSGVALAVTAGTRLVAARCPNHPHALALIAAAGVPVAAPSANRFGRISPTTAGHVVNQFASSPPSASSAPPASASGSSPSSSSADSASAESAQPASLAAKRQRVAEKEDEENLRAPDAKRQKAGKALEATLEARLQDLPPEGDNMLLLDGAEEECCCLGIESTVVKISAPEASGDAFEIQVLRRGVISAEMIEEALKAAAQRAAPTEQTGETAGAEVLPPFPPFSVRVSEKLHYHLAMEHAKAAPPPGAAPPERARGEPAHSEVGAKETQTEPHAAAPRASETHADDSTPMESPGLALTHYAPCLPCMLIVDKDEAEGRENADSPAATPVETPDSEADAATGANEKRRAPDATAAAREAAEKTANSRTGGSAAARSGAEALDASTVVVIDADRTLEPLKERFSAYFSLLPSEAFAAEGDAAGGTSKWKKIAQCGAKTVFATLHQAEHSALELGAKAILIHASPLLKGGEQGLAVFDRLYRSASGRRAEIDGVKLAMPLPSSSSSAACVRFLPLAC